MRETMLHYSGWESGEGHGFSHLFESHLTYLAGSHILMSWPGIQLKEIVFLVLSPLAFFHSKNILKPLFPNPTVSKIS
jgi:hypothetical protein